MAPMNLLTAWHRLGNWRWPLSGALLTLGFAPFFVWPLALASVVVWMVAVQHAPTRRGAVWRSCAWAMGWQVSALYWLPWAFYRDSDSLLFAALGGGAAVLALACYGALVPMLAAALAWRFRTHFPAFGAILIAVWMVCEVLKSLSPYGFPWLPLGAVWVGAPMLLQLASVGGVYLLGLCILVMAALIATWTPRGWVLAACVLALVAGFGAVRLRGAPDVQAAHGPVVRIVQPNIQSQHKWDPVLRWRYLAETLDVGLATGVSQTLPATVVLPETAVAFFLAQQADVQDFIGRRTPDGMVWLSGTVRRDETLAGPRFYNSMVAIDDVGVPVASYDKHMLVPFGEFIPLRSVLDMLPLPLALRTLSQSRLDFTHGRAFSLLPTPAGPAAGLICYEGIFPLFAARQAQGARWLVNVTNDNWFTGTTALYQHAALEVLRAVETGLPLVRSANTGLSLVVDPYGRDIGRMPVAKTAFLDVFLPNAKNHTIFMGLLRVLSLIP